MARNRNKKSSETQAEPAAAEPVAADSATGSSNLEIPEDEQWRIINSTGILNRIPRGEPGSLLEKEAPLANEILDSSLYIIPTCSLLILMDILVHNQYGNQPSLSDIIGRLGSAIPTKRHKDDPRMQLVLFLLSLGVGPRLMYVLAKGNYLTNVRQSPPLATIWVYIMVQLRLGPAVLNLLIVAAYVWLAGLKRYLIR
ncbi:hypothetical protein VNI00_005644 [Paramarasmius palmivorus]|uniref:DUF7719 domain-containing protein n=1 Tax=Paramarasmius palmivorus TaxID=297713 RepID=A0AAW0DEP2_9AGAR